MFFMCFWVVLSCPVFVQKKPKYRKLFQKLRLFQPWWAMVGHSDDTGDKHPVRLRDHGPVQRHACSSSSTYVRAYHLTMSLYTADAAMCSLYVIDCYVLTCPCLLAVCSLLCTARFHIYVWCTVNVSIGIEVWGVFCSSNVPTVPIPIPFELWS